MQDSLGGNAKTLMFVNISPADYNADETVTSLTYASRVKLIKNTANKNARAAASMGFMTDRAPGCGGVPDCTGASIRSGSGSDSGLAKPAVSC